MNYTLDPGSVINRAFAIYRDNFTPLILAAAALFAVQLVLSVALGGSNGVVVSLVGLILGTFYQGMVVELVRDVQDGRLDSSIGQLFASVAPVALTLVVVSFLAGIGFAIGFVLVVIPGLFLMTFWSVVAPVVVVERAGVLGAFRRSWALVKGNGWSVFAVVLVVMIGLAIVSALVAIIFAGLGTAAGAVIAYAVTLLTQPLSAVTAAVLYFALRERAGEPAVDAGAAGAAGV